jgi:hypothetical protein
MQMSRGRISLVIASLMIIFAATAYAGGWAILTVNDLPDYAITGKTLSMTFTVRQHGATLLDGLKPVVFAKAPDMRSVRIDAQPTKQSGEYRFELPLMQPGEWKISIDSGFVSYLLNRAPDDSIQSPAAGYVTFSLKVIPSGSSPLIVSDKERGERLFNVKGCTGCHGSGIGPDLSKKVLSADYVKRLLADPATTLKYKDLEYGQMPNLNLKPAEISALTEFVANH